MARPGRGDRDRVTILRETVKADLARHLASVRKQHDTDLERGAGWWGCPAG